MPGGNSVRPITGVSLSSLWGPRRTTRNKPELPTSAYNGRLRSGVGLPVVGTFWPDPTCIPSTQTPSTPKASWPHVHHQYVSPIVSFLSLSTTSSLRHPSHSRLTLGGWLSLPHPHHCPSNSTSSSQELPSRDEDFPSFHWSFWMLACSHTKDGGPKPSGATRSRARHRSFADRVAAMVTLDFVLQLLLQLQPGYRQDKLS